MMYLHNEHDLFAEVIYSTASALELPVPIVEKDYYVTMILKLLSERAPACVFKGGTSLSKCHHVIERFSEDVDITFSNTLTQGHRQKLKNQIIASILENEVYKDDYTTITTYFQQNPVSYNEAITALQTIASSDIFIDAEFE